MPPEREIPGVAGWAASRPVRVGNAAGEQRQLDALATIIDATWTYTNNGGRMNARRWAVVDTLADMLAAAPFEPTSGVWELRRPVRLLSEEIARWQGLDRALRLRRRRPTVAATCLVAARSRRRAPSCRGRARPGHRHAPAVVRAGRQHSRRDGAQRRHRRVLVHGATDELTGS